MCYDLCMHNAQVQLLFTLLPVDLKPMGFWRVRQEYSYDDREAGNRRGWYIEVFLNFAVGFSLEISSVSGLLELEVTESFENSYILSFMRITYLSWLRTCKREPSVGISLAGGGGQ